MSCVLQSKFCAQITSTRLRLRVECGCAAAGSLSSASSSIYDRLVPISEMTLRPLPQPPTQARRRHAPARLGILICGWLAAEEEPLQVWLDAFAGRHLLGVAGVLGGEERGWGDAMGQDEGWIVQGGVRKQQWSAGVAWREWSVLRWEMALLRQVGSAASLSGGGVAWRCVQPQRCTRAFAACKL